MKFEYSKLSRVAAASRPPGGHGIMKIIVDFPIYFPIFPISQRIQDRNGDCEIPYSFYQHVIDAGGIGRDLHRKNSVLGFIWKTIVFQGVLALSPARRISLID